MTDSEKQVAVIHNIFVLTQQFELKTVQKGNELVKQKGLVEGIQLARIDAAKFGYADVISQFSRTLEKSEKKASEMEAELVESANQAANWKEVLEYLLKTFNKTLVPSNQDILIQDAPLS